MRRMSMVLMSFVLAGTAAAAAGCAGATGDPTAGSGGNASGGGAKKNITVGVTIHQADRYFQTVQDTVGKLAKAQGGSSTVVNTQTDPGQEASGFQNLIARRVDAVIASPLSPTASLASVKSAADAGIKVVCYNTCLSPEDSQKYAAAFIQSDQKNLGTQTGQYAHKYLVDKGTKDVVLGMLNCNRYEACKQRQEGFVEALKAQGLNVKIVADQEALQPDEATKKATDILTAHPDINVLWAASDGATQGLVAAAKAAGKTKSVSVFGTDVNTTLVQAILDGDLVAITGQDSQKTGQLAFEAAQKAVAGEKADPFEVSLPGILYSTGDRAALEKCQQENK